MEQIAMAVKKIFSDHVECGTLNGQITLAQKNSLLHPRNVEKSL
jgi:hypothetical protein